jgi:hypothetical protein
MPLQSRFLAKQYVYVFDVSLLCSGHEIIKENMIGGACSIRGGNEKCV